MGESSGSPSHGWPEGGTALLATLGVIHYDSTRETECHCLTPLIERSMAKRQPPK